MGTPPVTHDDIVRFADERVNLKRDDAKELRQQANRLREKLEGYLDEHPDFELRKMLLSGSLAKGTALKSISDIDVGCYVSSASAPEKISDLVAWLATKLRTAFPNLKPEQVKPKEYSVAVNFISTGNEVDIVPILYDGDPKWRGYLVSQDTGEKLMTSIPMHLDFIRKRKDANDKHFAQLVRLIKFWCKLQKAADEGFRFKSFMVELVIAFPASDEFRTTITFNDYYDPKTCKVTNDPVRIWDPVNCENNVAKLYTASNKDKIVQAALNAGDAVDSARRALTKGEAVRFWQKVFGSSFSA
jgi:tRNA nucleotidyltransferase (CCA-adding enzyme)